ncbi:methyl-accepting chemotaxis sensory transducer with Cache sensor [Aliiruegeria haliotis]|uniref:Methyl-accepting chemotaxis sensory transducer with Cache sensor n=1 Tax=Aliiruegeria haliotis TaxID=1280846 RepID=A0A2T0RSG9_9RHOB|nr:methyl-accepting chemotaxis protein [Aliiruegeria haliotis]PRY24145.1 methyl-accepting chemotaxis sensory transducer with Cache sensor [Aliiruegeria haliotis]
MIRARLSKLSTRFYAIVALATLLTAVLSETLLSLAVENAYRMRHNHLGDVVAATVSLLADLEEQVVSGELTRADAQAEAKRILNTIRFGDSGYFFTFDHDLNILVLPVKQEWVGTNKAGYEDANGLKLYQELRDVAVRDGAGAVSYQFIKPGSSVAEEKIGFAQNFEPWGWIVGTGSYVSDIRAELATLRNISNAVLGGSLLVLLVLSTVLVRSVAKPLNGLVERMMSMREGNYDAPVPSIGARGEIGDMARTIDVFRQALQEREQLQAEQAAKDADIAREREEAHRKEREMEAREAASAEERRQEEERQRAEREAQRASVAAEQEQHRQEQELVVTALADSLKAISAGNLSTRIDAQFPEAYETLRQDFNQAVEKIAGLVGSIVEGSATITVESQNLNTAAAELSRRTESQAASLEETAAAITELSSSLDSSVHGATDAAKTVTRARERSVAGRDVVQRTIVAMSEIADSSDKISKITSVIDDIAFQTNLLALNAGVEAARAGDAGRGFAVVASEVRALAQRSSEAAREIAHLIATSGQQVESGVSLVNDSGSSLEEIEALVSNLDELVGAIADATTQQATGLSEISTAVNRLDQVTQQNAAMFEETSAAVMALQTQAQVLDQNSGSFTLGGDPRPVQRAS